MAAALWAAYSRMAIEAAAARLRPSVCNRPVARRMSSVVAMLPNSNSAAGVKARTNPTRRSSPRLSDSVRRPTLLATVRRASRAAAVMASREPARNHGEPDGVPDPECGHQCGREQRTDDRAGVVAGSLDAERPAVGLRRNQRGQQRVPGGGPDATRCPGQRAQGGDLPHRDGEADRAGRECRSQIAAGRQSGPADGVVGQCPPASLLSPTRASDVPSMAPSAPGPACSVAARKLGSTEVAIS